MTKRKVFSSSKAQGLGEKVEKRRVKVVLGPGKRMYVRLEAACGISVARY